MPTSDHIVSGFDRDLEGIQAQIAQMGSLVGKAIVQAADALETRDLELARAVRAADAAIDALDAAVNDEAARVIAQRQPIAKDLRTVVTVFRISNNLERIGDYAKNIAKRTEVINDQPLVAGAGASLRRMAHQVEGMLADALTAYATRDAALAQDVRNRDMEVDQMYSALFREYLTFMMEDPRSITTCMHLHFIAKNVERMGDHVTSIAELVIYMATGTLPDDERPKQDQTSAPV